MNTFCHRGSSHPVSLTVFIHVLHKMWHTCMCCDQYKKERILMSFIPTKTATLFLCTAMQSRNCIAELANHFWKLNRNTDPSLRPISFHTNHNSLQSFPSFRNSGDIISQPSIIHQSATERNSNAYIPHCLRHSDLRKDFELWQDASLYYSHCRLKLFSQFPSISHHTDY